MSKIQAILQAIESIDSRVNVDGNDFIVDVDQRARGTDIKMMIRQDGAAGSQDYGPVTITVLKNDFIDYGFIAQDHGRWIVSPDLTAASLRAYIASLIRKAHGIIQPEKLKALRKSVAEKKANPRVQLPAGIVSSNPTISVASLDEAKKAIEAGTDLAAVQALQGDLIEPLKFMGSILTMTRDGNLSEQKRFEILESAKELAAQTRRLPGESDADFKDRLERTYQQRLEKTKTIVRDIMAQQQPDSKKISRIELTGINQRQYMRDLLERGSDPAPKPQKRHKRARERPQKGRH